jgi:uncharacterized protein YndB with AHSA1/START domain
MVKDYPHPPEKVWRAVTDPALIRLHRRRRIPPGQAPAPRPPHDARQGLAPVLDDLDDHGALRPGSTLTAKKP